MNVTADGRPLSGYNQYHYDIPDTSIRPGPGSDPCRPGSRSPDSRAVPSREIGPPALIVHRYDPVEKKPPKPSRRPAGARARFLRRVRVALARAAAAGPGRASTSWPGTSGSPPSSRGAAGGC